MFETKTTLRRIFRPVPALSLCLTALAIQGCSSNIDCADAGIETNVIASVQHALGAIENFEEIELATAGKTALSGARLLATDSEPVLAACQAHYVFTFNGKERRIPLHYRLLPQPDSEEIGVQTDTDNVRTHVANIVAREPAIKNGVAQKMDPETGKVVQAREYKDDKLVARRTWSSDGQTMLSDIRWFGGKPDGFESQQHGDIRVDILYKDGIDNRKTFDTTGTTDVLILEENFRNDKADGMQRHYRQGELATESLFMEGKYVYSTGKPDAIEELEDRLYDRCMEDKDDDYRGDKELAAAVPEQVIQEWSQQCTI